MASATTLWNSGGAFVLPVESIAPVAWQADSEERSSRSTTAAEASTRPSSSWASWGCLAAAAVAGSAGARVSRRTGRTRRRAAERETCSWEALPAVSRAGVLRGIAGAGTSSALLPLAPAPAAAKSLEDARRILSTYGLADLAPEKAPPGGWNVVVEAIGLAPDAYYGRFKLGGVPSVVTFITPPLWVVTVPNLDFNGAAGTVQANDYGKGDSATLWVDTAWEGPSMDQLTKKDLKKEILKALTTKGKGFIEALTIDKVMDGAPGYKICEYSYDIQSAAGFSIARTGIGAVTQVGEKSLQVFWTGVVTTRWKDMKKDLLAIAQSFRIGEVPKNISTAMFKEFKGMDQEVKASDLNRSPF